MVIFITDTIKVDTIRYRDNNYDPLAITEPLSVYRFSYIKFPRTTDRNYNNSLNHYDIKVRGTFKDIKNKEDRKMNQYITEESSDPNNSNVKTNDKVEAYYKKQKFNTLGNKPKDS